MYKLLLILKYLRRKLAPMFAAVAVMLCTFMVITVISVMGGFLHLLRDAAKKLTGDVVVTSNTLTGFAHYDELIADLVALPEVEVATPVIQTFGLININGYTRGVNVQGVRPPELDQIVEYKSTLLWSNADLLADLEREFSPQDRQIPDEQATYERRKASIERHDLTELAMTLTPPALPGAPEATQGGPAGMVIGVEVSPNQRRDKAGQYDIRDAAIGDKATLTLLPLTQRGATRLEPSYATFTIVNEFKSGLYDVDANAVFVPFEQLQRLLDMDPKEVDEVAGYDANGEPITRKGTRAARTSQLMVKAAPGFTVDQVRDATEAAVRAWSSRHSEILPPVVLTWEEVHRTLISAVQNETGLVTFLFVMISGVAVVMVATTFYMIVLEKTRDIGVLRALGASGSGIMGMFLGYGFAVGLVGSVAGLAIAVFVVTHLNELQNALATQLASFLMWVAIIIVTTVLGGVVGFLVGRRSEARIEGGLIGVLATLGVGLCFAYFAFDILDFEALATFNDRYGWRMWDPQTYFFDRIPDRVNPLHASLIVVGAIISSVIGALVPAFIASIQNPVESLRYE